MTNLRKNTRQIVLGIVDVATYFLLFAYLVHFLFAYFDVGVDPTDKDGFNRSGLRYYKDYGTGVEYIGNGKCIIERVVP